MRSLQYNKMQYNSLLMENNVFYVILFVNHAADAYEKNIEIYELNLFSSIVLFSFIVGALCGFTLSYRLKHCFSFTEVLNSFHFVSLQLLHCGLGISFSRLLTYVHEAT